MRDVEIRNLVLRLPGVTRAAAQGIAEEVARRLADTIPEWRETYLLDLATVRVRLPSSARQDEIARLVAAGIAKALR